MKLLPNTFVFSPTKTLISVLLALVMLRAASWQWERYHYKKDLVATYRTHDSTPAKELPHPESPTEAFEPLYHQKVKVSGVYDFTREMIVINRRGALGAGYWILTPLKIKDSEFSLIVSRGFIPFKDATPESWVQYQTAPEVEIEAVVQPTIRPRTLLSPEGKSAGPEGEAFARKWKYPDIEAISEQLPYPMVKSIFLQKLKKEGEKELPAEAVTISVPPSTHFGYTIEWILLAFASLLVGFLLQAYPRMKFSVKKVD